MAGVGVQNVDTSAGAVRRPADLPAFRPSPSCPFPPLRLHRQAPESSLPYLAAKMPHVTLPPSIPFVAPTPIQRSCGLPTKPRPIVVPAAPPQHHQQSQRSRSKPRPVARPLAAAIFDPLGEFEKGTWPAVAYPVPSRPAPSRPLKPSKSFSHERTPPSTDSKGEWHPGTVQRAGVRPPLVERQPVMHVGRERPAFPNEVDLYDTKRSGSTFVISASTWRGLMGVIGA